MSEVAIRRPPFVEQLRRALHFDPLRIDVRHGARLAIIVGTPIVLGLALDRLDVAMYITLAALNVGIADPGGPYRRRLVAMVAASISITAAIALATVVVGHPLLVVVCVMLWTLGSALAADIGPGANGVGFVAAVMFIVGLGLPEGEPDLALRVLYFIIGCSWALLATFVVWPIRPGAPEHSALNAVYGRVAVFLSEMPHGDLDRSAARDQIAADLVAARDAVLDGHHHGRFGMRRAIDALAAAETIELGLGALDRAMGNLADPAPELVDAIAEIEACCRAIADSVRRAEEWETESLRNALTRLIAADLDGNEAIARGAILRMAGDLTEPQADWPAEYVDSTSRRGVAVQLRSLLDLESLVFRHAVRLGVVVAIAEVLALLDPFERGYWIPLTVVTVLKPDFGSTLDRGLQRIVGTVLGILVALALVLLLGDYPWLLAIALIVATFALGTVIEANYAVGVVALTPSVILLLAIADANADVVFLRLFDTLIGGALAFLGGLVLWPMWERTTLAGTLGAAAAAAAAYLRALADGGSMREVHRAHMAAERRRSNAEASLRRMLSEPRSRWVAPAAVLAYCGRTRSVIESTTAVAMLSRAEDDTADVVAPVVGDAPDVLDAIDAMFTAVESDPFGAPDSEGIDDESAGLLDAVGRPPDRTEFQDDPYGRLGGRIHTDASVMRRNALTIARHLR
ncbi:MAG: FUSC family protein [Actinomycetota bacterium]